MNQFEHHLERIRDWVRDHSGMIREALLVLACDRCGLTREDATPLVWATIEEFLRTAGRTPEPERDFQHLLAVFRGFCLARFAGTDPALPDLLRDLPDRGELEHALKEFPGGLMASLPVSPPPDWRNAVLAMLPGRGNGEPFTPWVHPSREEKPVSRSALTALLDRLFDADPKIRRMAAEALGFLGSDAADAVRALQTALEDPDSEVSSAAREALTRIAKSGDS